MRRTAPARWADRQTSSRNPCLPRPAGRHDRRCSTRTAAPSGLCVRRVAAAPHHHGGIDDERLIAGRGPVGALPSHREAARVVSADEAADGLLANPVGRRGQPGDGRARQARVVLRAGGRGHVNVHLARLGQRSAAHAGRARRRGRGRVAIAGVIGLGYVAPGQLPGRAATAPSARAKCPVQPCDISVAVRGL